MKHDFYLVIDVEATCDDQGSVPRTEMEIIEIGAVLVHGQTFESVCEFQTFIQPVRHPTLTPFCISLTSIAQRLVSHAPKFPAAIADLRSFIADRDVLFCSWGAYDNGQFRQDAAFHGVSLPFRGLHLNLKKGFSRRQATKRRFGMAGALRRMGLDLSGTHHRGIDDARNIARLLPHCIDSPE